MKGAHPVITLLGNNSGRNLGDATILSSILNMFTEELPDAEFLVPSVKPKFINDNYGKQFNVKGLNVLPHTGSIRLFGIPTIRAFMKSDIALICDGIIFGYKLWSPHNFLVTLVLLLPFLKLSKCKLICFNCGIGPFPSRLSRTFARWVINSSDLVIMRENDSKALAEAIGVTKEIEVTGDAAFVNTISSKERAEEILRHEGLDPERPMLGVNVTPYIDSWLEKTERVKDADAFLGYVSEGITSSKTALAAQGEDVQIVIFSCSPMDELYSAKLAKQVGGVVIDNSKYLSHDIQAVMQRCGLLVGMRFHSLVLSSAVGVPIIGLVYAPKVKGYMRLLECENYCVELADITPELLTEKLVSAWLERKTLARKQQPHVETLKTGARNTAATIHRMYYPGTTATKLSNVAAT